MSSIQHYDDSVRTAGPAVALIEAILSVVRSHAKPASDSPGATDQRVAGGRPERVQAARAR